MKLVYTDHLKTRLKQREISTELVTKVIEKNEQAFWDNLRDRHIIVSKVIYKDKARHVLVAYDKIGKNIEVVTIHPISSKEIDQKIKSGRWTDEKIED